MGRGSLVKRLILLAADELQGWQYSLPAKYSPTTGRFYVSPNTPYSFWKRGDLFLSFTIVGEGCGYCLVDYGREALFYAEHVTATSWQNLPSVQKLLSIPHGTVFHRLGGVTGSPTPFTDKKITYCVEVRIGLRGMFDI